MLKFAANLSLLFTEVSFIERFAAAAAAGFKAVECQFPYRDVSATELARLLADSAQTLVLFNIPAGDWAAGDKGIACDPARIDEFRAGVELALEYAHATGCQQLNCLPGLLPKGVSRDIAEATLVANLDYAAAKLAAHGMTLLMEPINHFDIPDFLINSSDQAQALIKRVGAPNLRLQYDLYHMYRMGDDLIATLTALGKLVGHIQFADSPGRHQPGSGEVPLEAVFDWIANAAYDGWVSAEYHPDGDTRASLGWLALGEASSG